MTLDDILDMARSAGLTDGIELQHEIDAVMRFAELVAEAERKALANEFSEAVTKTLESLAATTLMPSPPMPTVISNLDAIAAAVAAERESVCAKGGGVTMSMHKIPLTDVEREGLEKHGLGQNIGKPSQLADAFRQGVKWGREQEREACAKVCEDFADGTSAYEVHRRFAAYKCAYLIRKRGENENLS